jgi:hypothetical protein
MDRQATAISDTIRAVTLQVRELSQGAALAEWQLTVVRCSAVWLETIAHMLENALASEEMPTEDA